MSSKNNILGIDTATAETVIGLNGEVVSWISNRNQSKELLPAIDKLIRSQKLTPQQVRGIVVNTGPGSFTGLRVGLTVANGFGYGLKIPVVGMSEFDVIRLVYPKVDLIILDAKRGELFVQSGKQKPKLISATKLGEMIKRGTSVYLEINLAVVLHPQLKKVGTIYLTEIPRIEKMAAMLKAGASHPALKLRDGLRGSVVKSKKFSLVLPMYLRGANITKPKVR
ncbi:MAG: tRNA (adenosine(37)-N6)-threonylcarbamoyltransferase complex dimerization subunit type 1 TsaB [Patescibacteria group bacterium]|jgi:tRNA threonylcarbamoyladenosine biosynthesis protein TsaB